MNWLARGLGGVALALAALLPFLSLGCWYESGVIRGMQHAVRDAVARVPEARSTSVEIHRFGDPVADLKPSLWGDLAACVLWRAGFSCGLGDPKGGGSKGPCPSNGYYGLIVRTTTSATEERTVLVWSPRKMTWVECFRSSWPLQTN